MDLAQIIMDYFIDAFTCSKIKDEEYFSRLMNIRKEDLNMICECSITPEEEDLILANNDEGTSARHMLMLKLLNRAFDLQAGRSTIEGTDFCYTVNSSILELPIDRTTYLGMTDVGIQYIKDITYTSLKDIGDVSVILKFIKSLDRGSTDAVLG